MAQFARPDSDIDNSGSWATTATNLYEVIDETSASDADYISLLTASLSYLTCEVSLSNVTDPASSSDHVVRYRYQKDASGGAEMDIQIRLLQGATEIASWEHTNIADSWADQTQTLSGGEADSITDYDDLRLEIATKRAAGSPGRETQLSWAEFEVPDAGGGGIEILRRRIAEG